MGRTAAVAVIGDSTFFHSGVTPLIDARYNETPGLVIVLDNRTTAMTGHQGHPGTGLHADRSSGPALDIEQLCRGIGVPATTVDAFDEAAVKAAIREALAGRELRVLVALAPCILMDRSPHERVRGRRRPLQPVRPVRRARLPGRRGRRRGGRGHERLHRLRRLPGRLRARRPQPARAGRRPGRAVVNGVATVSLAGVGGQGIILAAAIVAQAAMAAGFDVKASEVKGMAQRGGSVVSTVRYGKQVWSPVSPRADVVIATETLEGRRALGLLADRGTLVYATTVIAPGSVLRGERAYPGDLAEAARARDDAAHRRRRRGAGPRGRLGAGRQRRPAGRRDARAALRLAGLGARPRAGGAGQDPRAQPAGVRPRPRGGRTHRGGAVKVTQVTVFLENRSGRLAEIADILGRRGVNIRGFSTTEAAEYGIVRLIVPDPVAAREILHKEGFTTHLSQVICVAVADEPGGLARVLDTLAEQKISVDYLYSISFNNICFAVHDVDRAVELLRDKVTLLSDEQVKTL